MKSFKEMFSWDYALDELRSLFTTFLTILAIDGVMELTAVYNGDWSESALFALKMAILRSIVKTILTLCIPKLFPLRRS